MSFILCTHATENTLSVTVLIDLYLVRRIVAVYNVYYLNIIYNLGVPVQFAHVFNCVCSFAYIERTVVLGVRVCVSVFECT